MPLAILLVLILIAVILAPWLLGVIAVLVAAYGAVLISALVIGVLLVPLSLGAVWIFRRNSRLQTPERKMAARAAEFNRKYLQEADTARRKHAASNSKREPLADIPEVLDVPASGVTCSRCSKIYSLPAMVCPYCGKSSPNI
ncbi:hypothetical protein F0170_11100 [Pseudomonas sp. MAFF 730085]|uniref:Uncharacterized protein n=1 Tax=Pseudomonas kitaguniensis TaxID=2607908 RepID=A0A5N7JSW4_9PSED|nr:hypothetical protein [Pseudomonas kitaguniensis]MPQ84484.1 hypothetical protein [Pseudomonas kitaguniensis]